MLKSIFNILRFLPFYLKLYSDYRRILKYTNNLLSSVQKKFKNWDSLIDLQNQRRMRSYILIQTLWTAGFCLLRGDRIKNNEIKAIVNISALAPLYDDFFDKIQVSSQKIIAIVNTPFEYKSDSEIELICLEFSKRIHKHVSDISCVLEYAEAVFDAQNESRKLVSDSLLERDLVKKIAFNKGGATVICMCNMLNKKLSIQEEKLMYQLGGVAQYLDDIFDLREDYLEGRQTLANPIHNAAFLKKSFLKEVEKFKEQLKSSTYSKSNQLAFLIPVSYMLGATLLCTRRYELLEYKTNGEFKIEEYSRDELVLDMDKWLNKLKAFKFSLKV